MAERGYATSSEYIRELIRQDQDRQELRAKVLQGGSSPLDAPVEAYFERLRDRAQTHGGSGAKR